MSNVIRGNFKGQENISREELNILIECGREVGIAHLEQAVSSARDEREMNNQLLVCRVAAIHMLATDIYNSVKHGFGSVEECLKNTMESMLDEYNELLEVGTDMVAPGETRPPAS